MLNFLKKVYGGHKLKENYVEIRILNNTGLIKTEFIKITDDIESVTCEISKIIKLHLYEHVFFGVATRSTKEGKQENCSYLTALYLDIDEHAGEKFKLMSVEKRYLLIDKLVAALKDNKLKPTYIVSSGNGIHAYWALSKPIEVQSNIEKIKTALKCLTNLLDDFKGDSACTNIAQVLRLPGSNNVKDPNNIKKCEIIHSTPELLYDFSYLMEELRNTVNSEQNENFVKSEELYVSLNKSLFSLEELKSAAMQCNFLRDLAENSKLQTYPLWSYIASNLSVYNESGLTLFHEISKGYATYSQKATDKIFKDMGKKIKTGEVGPVLCQTICEAGYSCLKKCNQKSPAGMIYNLIKPENKETSNKFIKVASNILAKRKFMNIKDEFYEYKNGFWQSTNDAIKTLIINELGDEYKKSVVEDILYYITNKTSVNIDNVNNNKKQNIICLKNCMLMVNNDKAPVILPFNPDYYSINQIDVSYEPESKCPLWLNFLEQTFAKLNSEDRKITIEALKQTFGYLLLPGNSLQKIIFFIGASRSGKSVIISVVNALLGDKNVSGMAFKNLSKETNLAVLFGKLVNICGELDADDYCSASTLKQLCGEDKISGRLLYNNPISFYNEAKLIAAGNFFPKVKDNSGAFRERILAFPCDNQVSQNNRDPELKKKLIAELPAILNWAIEGRIQLFKTGYFIESTPMQLLKKAISEDNNTIEAWFECCKEFWFKKRMATLKEVFDDYKRYCESETEKCEKRKIFMYTIDKFNGIKIFKKSKPDQYMVEFNERAEDKICLKDNLENKQLSDTTSSNTSFISDPEDIDALLA